jgi:hypothetical protein
MGKPMFFGGVPTELEVKKLKQTYNELSPGQLITYEEVSELIGVEYGSHRFRTVTNRWRKEVESETNIIIGCDAGVGFKVLVEPEKVDLSAQKTRTAGRAARRAYVVAARTDVAGLDQEDRRRLDHCVMMSSKILGAAQLTSKPKLPKI